MARLRFPVWLVAALLVLVTVALYWPAMRCDFVNFDDPGYVTSNLHVQSGLSWEGVKWAFLKPVSCNWHPLTMLSHMVDCQLFGLEPWGHHLTSVLLHALNAALVFALLQQLTGAPVRSLFVAALFAVHPLRVESVAWVAERKDVLSVFFGLLSLIFYVRYAQRRSQGADHGSPAASSKLEVGSSMLDVQFSSAINYFPSLAFFICGLMSKPMLVTWPFVMLLLDYWPLRRFQLSASVPSVPSVAKNPGLWRLVFEKIPFFAFAAAVSVVTFLVQKHGGAVTAGENLPLGARGGNALVSYCRYLGKLFWPTDLAVFYPHPGHWPMGEVLLAGVLLVGISALLIVKWRRYPFLLMGWLWYCGTLVPVIGLVQAGEQAMADRFTYAPSIGVLIFAIWSAYELTRRWWVHVIALSVAGAAVLVLCFALTRQQIGYWKDSEAIFRHAIEVTESNYVAHLNVGTALVKKGQINEAISQYEEAIRLKPDDAAARTNLGAALVIKGQIDEAIRQYQEAIRFKPDYAEARFNLGNDLFDKGQIDEAISQYREAIRLKPDYAEARFNLGTALVNKGQIDEAIRQYQEVIRLKPDGAEAHYHLGTALVNKGQIDGAASQYREAIRLKPDYTDAHYNLGLVLGMKGQTDGAIRQFREVLRLKPDDADARNNLRNALLQKGKGDEFVR